MSCFIIPYNQSAKSNSILQKMGCFPNVCWDFLPFTHTCLSSFAPLHPPSVSWFSSVSTRNRFTVTLCCLPGAMFLAALTVCIRQSIMLCITLLMFELLMWPILCSEQVVSWFWCLRDSFIHCISTVAAVSQFSKQLINLKWDWLCWEHIQTKIYARGVGTRLLSYSFLGSLLSPFHLL